MKKLLLATIALSALAGSAFAADLPYRRAAPAPMPAFVAVPIFTWSGLYVGANAGYGFGDGNVTTTGLTPAIQAGVAGGVIPGNSKLKPQGFVGGGQIGYNYQIGRMVLGLETDIQYTDLSKGTSFSASDGVSTVTTSHSSSLDYLGTVRGRIGYAIDRWMIYGTGGLAYGDVNNAMSLSTSGPGGGAVLAAGRSETRTGYAVGAGVEYAIPAFNFGSSAATLKAEYMYYDLGKTTLAVLPTAPIAASRFENDGHIVRAGLNWKFGGF